MNRLCFRPFAALFLLSVLPLSAQVSLTGGGYVENFDGMGTGTAPPVGWGFWGALGGDANTWSNAVGVLTTGTGNMTGGTQNNVLSPATTFATNSNTAGFNYALSTSTADRALGGAPTTGSGVALELSLTNGTGATVNAIQVSYLIRRFTAPATANELPGFWLFYNVNGAGWVNVPALNPTVAGPAGVIVPNTTGVTTVPATSVGLNTPWTSGSTLRLRWVDDNATNTSPDQIVGLDNVSIQVSQPPPVVTLTAPAAGSLFAPSAVVPMTADATDDGAVTKVEFFAGGTKVGEDTTAPYAFNWTPASPGTYSLTAVATDNFGSTTTSAAVGITALGAADVVSFTGSRYFQTFNGLGVTPPASTVTPSGWSFVGALGGSSTTWTDALGVLTTGTGNMSGGTATTALTLMPAALNSASNTNGFNIGVTDTDLDRALGTSPTGGSGVILQLTLTNNTGTDLNDVALSYLIRRFTAPATANELPGYWLFYSLGSGPWTNVSALNPSVSGPGGVVIPSTAGTTTVPLTIVNLATPWTSGALLRFRWVDDNAVTSPEQILGIDDVAVQLNQPAPVVTLTAPANGASIQMPGPVTITADATDNSAVTKVEFFAGSTKVGEDTSAPYAFDWMPALSGTYLLTAVATDDSGATATSAPVSVQVFNPNNIPPQAVVISPAAGTSVPASSLTVLASASDTDGYITKVAFYCNGVKEGEVTGEPYLFTIPSISAGPLTLTVEATDNDGGTTVSAPVAVNALAFSNTELISRGAVWSYWDKGTDLGTAWKEVNYVEPEPWSSGPAEFGYGDAPVTVLQQGPDGTVSSSKFITYYFRRTFTIADVSQVFSLAATLERDDGALIYLNGQEVARSNMPTFEVNYLTGASTAVSGTDETTYFPITLPVSALVNGTNVIAVEVHQNANNSSDLSFDMDLTATVAGGNALPSVAITSPAGGATFSSLAVIPITVNAADPDGTVAKVEFFANGSKVGESTASPFSFTWTDVSAGAYSLTAVATDDLNATRTSSAVSVTVNAGPSGLLTRGPYLQRTSPVQTTIRWRSSVSIAGRVRYGTSPDSLTQFVDEPAATTEHIVPITGLSPSTTYYYNVGSSLDVLASGADFTFVTHPPSGTVMPIRIWALGDAGTNNANQTNVRNAFYNWTGPRTPDFVLQLGDNAYNSGTDTEFQGAVFNMYSAMLRKTTFWSCIGNHETDQATAFVDTYPYFNVYTFPTAGECGGVASGTEHYYSFDYGNIHIISLDSMTASRSSTGAMATWLQADLASTTATWIVCMFHHPPYTKGSHNSDSETELIQMRQNFNPILEAGGVDLVLNGHSHCYERSYLLDGHYGTSDTLTAAMKVNGGDGRPAGNGAYVKPLTGPRDHFGTVYCVTGSAGQATGGTLNHAAHFISLNELGSLVLDVNGNRLDATLIRDNSSIRDTYTIFKQGAADTDHDGLPDEWEIANGLDRFNAADAAQDTDGDGLTNTQEYLAGTSPKSGADLPQVAAITAQPNGSVVLQLNTVNGKFYKVEANNSFPSGPWTTVAASVAGTGGFVSVTDAGAIGVSNRIYRVTVLP